MSRHRVAALVLCPTYGNPLGHCMPDEKKRRLAALLERVGIPLVEDDVYGDVSFSARRPPPVQGFRHRRQRAALLVVLEDARAGASRRLGGAGPPPSRGRAPQVQLDAGGADARRSSRSPASSRRAATTAPATAAAAPAPTWSRA